VHGRRSLSLERERERENDVREKKAVR
jgi:hypothetical protein